MSNENETNIPMDVVIEEPHAQLPEEFSLTIPEPFYYPAWLPIPPSPVRGSFLDAEQHEQPNPPNIYMERSNAREQRRIARMETAEAFELDEDQMTEMERQEMDRQRHLREMYERYNIHDYDDNDEDETEIDEELERQNQLYENQNQITTIKLSLAPQITAGIVGENVLCECPICYENDCNTQTQCQHAFCSVCIVKHALYKEIPPCCPLCRSPITEILFDEKQTFELVSMLCCAGEQKNNIRFVNV